MPNALKDLQRYGQSVWLDYIRRNLITGGELRRIMLNGLQAERVPVQVRYRTLALKTAGGSVAVFPAPWLPFPHALRPGTPSSRAAPPVPASSVRRLNALSDMDPP